MVEYQDIVTFVNDYFRDYSRFAQDEETMPKMDRYWDEDIKVTAYFKLEGGEYPFHMPNRREWQDFLIKGHLTIWENLEPLDIMIDPVRMKTSSMLRVTKFDRKTDKQLFSLDGIGYYSLAGENADSLRITSLDFFTGDARTFAALYTME
ncbi:MAG: hypothetical protein MI717_13440 [Spirochaetales bacterium]|nr:hypothetical protein [Spirochaetales bacterium]